MESNPFKPTAGAVPTHLIGRRAVLDEVAESFDNGPGAPARLALFTGARGIGKTVMLSEVEALAQKRGWVTVAETSTPGLADRLAASLDEARTQLTQTRPRFRRIRSVTLPTVLGTGGGGIELENPASPTASPSRDYRSSANRILDAIEPTGAGLLITIDEVHRKAREDMREVATSYQHLVREGRNVALVMAGLPSAISDLLNDAILTFLRRATPFHLGPLDLSDVHAFLDRTIEDSGRTITPEALSAATDATAGYPFMVQLVGYHIWQRADHGRITDEAAAAGIAVAIERL
ncbi:MAG: ATP-binding protein, partial [Bifidobacteriaceae bacterium]|nr:ATP-binding protein [Bifidobacteriaceae bacterium]